MGRQESVNESVERLLAEASVHVNENRRPAADPEPAVVTEVAEDPMDLLSSLSAKLATLEENTSELNNDSLGLLEQLEQEQAEFAHSRARAQISLDSLKELDSDETRDAMRQLMSFTSESAEDPSEDALEELRLKQLQAEQHLSKLMKMRSQVAQKLETKSEEDSL